MTIEATIPVWPSVLPSDLDEQLQRGIEDWRNGLVEARMVYRVPACDVVECNVAATKILAAGRDVSYVLMRCWSARRVAIFLGRESLDPVIIERERQTDAGRIDRPL